MFSTTQSSQITKSSAIARISSAIALASVILTASAALAEEPAPPKPSAQEIAILRGLLGLRPTQPAAPVAAPVPSTEASNPGDVPALPPATPKSAVAPGADTPVTSDAGVAGTSGYNVARAIMAARSVSQKLQLASR